MNLIRAAYALVLHAPPSRQKRRLRAIARSIHQGAPLTSGQRRWLVAWVEFAAQRPGPKGEAAQRVRDWLIERGAREARG